MFLNEFTHINIDLIIKKYPEIINKIELINSLNFIKNKAIVKLNNLDKIYTDDNIKSRIARQFYYLNEILSINISVINNDYANFIHNFFFVLLSEIYLIIIDFLKFTNEDFFEIIYVIRRYLELKDEFELILLKYKINISFGFNINIDKDLYKCLKNYVFNKENNKNMRDQQDLEIYILYFIHSFLSSLIEINEEKNIQLILGSKFKDILSAKQYSLDMIQYPNFMILSKEFSFNKKKNKQKKKAQYNYNSNESSFLSTIKETSSLFNETLDVSTLIN